ncbi:MAG: DNA repair protein RadC [Christensenellaceae bacterium]|nr:DNA repair protein RadC [Christensenellaceae bacterium]
MHKGHRQRMRERFRKEGLEGFAHHEVLELLMFYSHARGDVNPLAHELLDAFGTLKGVLEARPEQLMAVPGVGEETATLISLVIPLFRRYQACIREEQTRIGSREDAKTYSVSLLAGRRTERFYVLCLSAANKILGQRLISVGSLAEVSAYPRQVIETALNYNASSVILCHNHPGGTLRPSADDIAATRRIQAVLAELDIRLMDHIIVAGDDAYSMMQHGDLGGIRQDGAARRLYKSGKEGSP